MKPKKEDKLRVKELSTLIRLHSHNYHVLDEPEIEDLEYDQLFQELLSAGVRTTVHYKPLNKFSIFRKLGKIGDKLKNSNELYDEILSLPLYPDIKKEDQKIVIKIIRSIQKK